MRTRQKYGGEPEPEAPWHEIVPGMWMGGHHWAPAGGEPRPAIVGSEFDLVVSLYRRDGHGPHPGVEHLVAEIPDAPLATDQLLAARGLARRAAQAVADGRAVLVRCRSGYNRSGLVVAQTLVDLGHEAGAAVELVRARWSKWALNNRVFVEYLATGLETAALLTGLGDAGDTR
ncbi:protein phosphatase [Streptomyces sp. SKN60]|uniref:protein-tyrosine phosphatase family protein n=1 Tax=Streptomyces sp. SKN60 TaxID=2855506 RepID=UPI00224549B2|nr:protein phosphatase [Streptomyces sp. SKN60]MCX2184546.1 protein phosphatase [Streptomyces sp. SKN60]